MEQLCATTRSCAVPAGGITDHGIDYPVLIALVIGPRLRVVGREEGCLSLRDSSATRLWNADVKDGLLADHIVAGVTWASMDLSALSIRSISWGIRLTIPIDGW